MEYMAPASVAGSKHGTKLLSFRSLSVLLHAWSNTVLGGMYTLTSLCGFPSLKTWIVSLVQIAVIMLVLLVFLGKRTE